MVGILLKSKKVTKPKISISFGKKKDNVGGKTNGAKPTTAMTKNIMGGSDEEEDDEDDKIIPIETFDRREGALSEDIEKRNEPLKIIPKYLNRDILRSKKEIEFTAADSVESSELNYGLNETKNAASSVNLEEKAERVEVAMGKEDLDLTIPVSNAAEEEVEVEDIEYNNVPVEEFGAALLRGMGWKGDRQKPKSKSVEKRQRSAILGIGAKPLDNELVEDLMGKKKVIGIPLKKKRKVQESEQRR